MITLLSPGDPSQRTGGYLYNARLVRALRERGHEVQVVSVEGVWPLGPVDAVSLPESGAILADGLLWSALRPQVPDAALSRVAVLVHSVLAAEGGEDLAEREAHALHGVGAVVATGGPTERDLAAMGVASVRVEPGTDPAARLHGPGKGRLLSLGTVTPRKGLLRLLEALEAVAEPWSLDVVGSLTRDPHHAAQVVAMAQAFGDRVRFLGEQDDAGVQRALARADLLVHAAHYEAYGMVLAEAMARGVPVLCTPAGAAEGGGAEVVAPAELAAGLSRLLADPSARAALAERAWHRGRNLPTWGDVAGRIGTLLAGLEAV